MYQLYDNVTTLKWVPMDIRGLFRFLAFVFGPLVPIMLPSALLWAAQYLPK